jgi:response regulator RpfG family c-di-GMP phosphodiesterase
MTGDTPMFSNNENDNDEEFMFQDEVEETSSQSSSDVWHILIVDDEPQVHQVTEMVLKNFEFNNKSLKFYNAYSAAEAKELLAEREYALALVDVVMETEHAGLELAKYIRNEIFNHTTRVVLRTGQPGQAPEETVIRELDINDYKDKTELTVTKLKTLFYSTLRSYRDIKTIDLHRKGLEKVIKASNEIMEFSHLEEFASAMLMQVTNILGLDENALYLNTLSAFAASHRQETYQVLAATGEQFEGISQEHQHIPDEIMSLFKEALTQKASLHKGNDFVGYFATRSGSENLLYVSNIAQMSELDHNLLEIFSNSVAIAYENLLLRDEIEDTQRELVYLLGEAVEKRSKETGGHVKRVAKISQILASKAGMDETYAELIKHAAPLHDVGKIAIPDAILNKPGKHTPEEWQVMQTHAQVGYEILSQSDKRILQLGATIAQQHHEKWDGTGYPGGLAAEEIDIAGRIVALADVFDALGSKRCYKEAWPLEKIVALIKDESGRQFDPKLVNLLLENLDEIAALRESYPDED